MTGSAMRELQYLGFKTIEQLASASDEVKRKLGPLSKFVKLAQEWLAAAKSEQADVVKLKQLLDVETSRRKQLEHKVELLLQRIEGNEGIDLREQRKEVIPPLEALEEGIIEAQDERSEVQEVRRRGRPKKV